MGDRKTEEKRNRGISTSFISHSLILQEKKQKAAKRTLIKQKLLDPVSDDKRVTKVNSCKASKDSFRRLLDWIVRWLVSARTVPLAISLHFYLKFR